MKKLSATKGFTLIELLVVIAIIGLLSSIVFASLGGARAKGRVAAAQGSMRDIITSAILCIDEGATVTLPTETQSGGGGDVCSPNTVVKTKYKNLPTGWTYCDGVDGGVCTGTANSVAATPKIVAKGDSKTITCDDTGCTTN